jgi:hypothetical protein
MKTVNPVEFVIPPYIITRLEKAAKAAEGRSLYNVVVYSLVVLLILTLGVFFYLAHIHPRLHNFRHILISDELHAIYIYIFACITAVIIAHEIMEKAPIEIHQQMTVPYFVRWQGRFITIDNLTKISGSISIPLHNIYHILSEQDFIGLLIAEKMHSIAPANHLFIVPKDFFQQVMKHSEYFRSLK